MQQLESSTMLIDKVAGCAPITFLVMEIDKVHEAASYTFMAMVKIDQIVVNG